MLLLTVQLQLYCDTVDYEQYIMTKNPAYKFKTFNKFARAKSISNDSYEIQAYVSDSWAITDTYVMCRDAQHNHSDDEDEYYHRDYHRLVLFSTSMQPYYEQSILFVCILCGPHMNEMRKQWHLQYDSLIFCTWMLDIYVVFDIKVRILSILARPQLPQHQ